MERGTVSGVPHGQSTGGLLGGWNSLCSHPNLFQRPEQCQVEFESETISTQRSLLLSSLSRRFMLQTQGSGPFCSSMNISQKRSERGIRLQSRKSVLWYRTLLLPGTLTGGCRRRHGAEWFRNSARWGDWDTCCACASYPLPFLWIRYRPLQRHTHTNLGRQPMGCGMEESSSPLKSALHLTRCSQEFFLDLL